MKIKTLAILLTTALCTLTLNTVQAETIEEIESKVNSYMSSGEISDVAFGYSLGTILSMAKASRNAGDTASKDNYMEAFKTAVAEGSGTLLTSGAAMSLSSMVP